MTNKDHVYMQPVPTKDKETIIRALKSIINKIENSDTGFGVLVNYVQVTNVTDTEKDGDKFETANILIGHQYIITHNLTREITEDTDYTRLFAGILHNLD